MTVVIPTGARVIDIDLDTAETNVFKNVPYETHEQFYSTDIGMAFLKFTGLEQDYTGCTARLTLINFNDGSKVQRIFEMDTTTTFVYPMLETELVHAGRWIGQLAVIKGGTTISDNPFRFKINGPIMNTALISFDNINTFTSQLTTIYDGLNTFLDVVISDESGRTDAEGLRVVAEGLRVTAEELRATAETDRQTTFEANEIIRDGIVNSLVTAETIAQKVAEKYQLIEAESANRLLSVEQQLALAATKAELSAIATPLAVSLVSQMTNTARIYVYTGSEGGYTTGNWYYHNGAAWASGGVYQATGISDGSITGEKTTFVTINSLLNRDTVLFGKFLSATNTLSDALYNVSDYITIDPLKVYTVNYHRLTCFYDANKAFISAYDTGTSSTLLVQNIVIPANAVYLRTNIMQTLYDVYYIYETTTKYKLNKTVINQIVEPKDTSFIAKYNFMTGVTLYDSILLNNDGTTAVNAAYTTSGFVTVKEASVYTAATHRRTVFYGDGKVVIGYFDSGIPTHVPTYIVTPAGCKYLKTTIPTTELTGWYLYAKSYSSLLLRSDVVVPKTTRFSGKKYCSIGDSITWQDGNVYAYNGKVARGYQTIIKEELGFATVVNKGYSGWKLLDMWNEYSMLTTYYTDINAADVITLMACTNDFQLNTPLGLETSFDTSNFSGALNALLRDITQANVGKPFLCFATPQRKGFGIASVYTTQQTNDIGLTLKDYVDRFVLICKNYSLPVFNLCEYGGLNKYNIDTLTRDGLHPIDIGYEVFGYKCAEFINNYA